MVVRPSAERDSTNLGYFESDIKACLLSLSKTNFLKSETYLHNGRQIECDVYLIQHRGPTGCTDDLYVKFNFSGWVVVHSIHLQR